MTWRVDGTLAHDRRYGRKKGRCGRFASVRQNKVECGRWFKPTNQIERGDPSGRLHTRIMGECHKWEDGVPVGAIGRNIHREHTYKCMVEGLPYLGKKAVGIVGLSAVQTWSKAHCGLGNTGK